MAGRHGGDFRPSDQVPGRSRGLRSKSRGGHPAACGTGGHPSFYQKLEFSKEAQCKFQAPKWPLEKFEHIVKDGFIGQIWRPEDWKDRQVFNSWEELAQLLGNMIAIGEQLERSS